MRKVVIRVNSNADLTTLFFKDLRAYNSTNFRTLVKASDITDNATLHKAFSSVVTRYFIFAERHPEITPADKRMLYYKLKIDLIARYFSEYPDVDPDLLKAFQLELKQFVKSCKGELEDDDTTAAV